MSINLMLLASQLLSKTINSVGESAPQEAKNIESIFKKIASQPIKMLASFFFSPFLIIRIALKVKNPIRRVIAIAGIILSLAVSYLAGTILGSMAGFLFIMTHVGVLTALGFLIGTTLSIFLSVTFSLLSFNLIAFLFLKFSTQEIADYLNEISQ